MRQVLIRVILSLVAPICIPACTDKDREMAKKTNDGTETFEYRPDARLEKKSEKGNGQETAKIQRPPQVLPTAASSEQTKNIPEVRTRKFEYKPDPRMLKQMSKKSKSE